MEDQKNFLKDDYFDLAIKWEKFNSYKWDKIYNSIDEDPDMKTNLWKIGDYIDVKDKINAWAPARIIDIDTGQSSFLELYYRRYHVKFLGWSDYFNEWDEKLHRDFDRVNTINKLKRSIRLFKNLVGNLVLDQIEPHHAYEFADAQLVNNPDVALKTLQNYNWGCQEYFKYLVERGIIKNNPFWGINLGRRGKRPKSWQPFTRDELYEVFRYDWDEELRVLLALLVVTGIRLEEAVEPTWERFNDTEYQGIRYFSLLSTGFEEVNVKTESSVRYVIIHQDLELPPVLKTGRLFSFRHGEAGQRINPVLETLFNNPRKRVHSFRRTFKLMYRDEGVDEHSIDALIGHAEGDASKRAYAGVGVPRRHELLSRLRHPWLNSSPKG